jgi:hypothetical protein
MCKNARQQRLSKYARDCPDGLHVCVITHGLDSVGEVKLFGNHPVRRRREIEGCVESCIGEISFGECAIYLESDSPSKLGMSF